MTTMYELFHHAGADLTLQQVFLILGGIKNSLLYIQQKSVKLFIPSGFTDISCPFVFEKFGFPYEAITVSDYIQRYQKEENFTTEYMAILPFSSEVLRVRELDYVDLTLFGQSYLPIHSVDSEGNRFILRTDDEQDDSSWIDIDVCLQLESSHSWLLEDNLSVYILSRKQLKQCQFIQKIHQLDSKELLEEMATAFLKNTYVDFNDGVVRIEGEQVYVHFIKQFEKCADALRNTESQKQQALILKYVKVELRYFRQFILAGTDGYYRNEFAEVLKVLFDDESNPSKILNIKQWELISKKWRVLGRKLDMRLKRNKDIEEWINTLEVLVKHFHTVQTLETAAIHDLKQILASEKKKYLFSLS